MKVLLTPKSLGTHGETPHPRSSPRVLGDEKVTGSDEETDNPVPSKKSKVNEDDERTNQNRNSDRDDPPPADPKSIVGDIFSPMKSFTSVDDTTTFTDIDVDAVLTKSPGLKKTSPTVNEETNCLSFGHLWAEKKLAHSSASKECAKFYCGDAREGVMDGRDEEEDEKSIAHVPAGWSQEEKKEDHKSYRGGNLKASPQLGIAPRPMKGSTWSHGICGTKIHDPNDSWESDDLPALQPAPEVNYLRVLDFLERVVMGKAKVGNLESFLDVCKLSLERDYNPEQDIETIVKALARITQGQYSKDPQAVSQVLTLCCDSWESISDSDAAEIIVMENALWAMRDFPNRQSVIGKALGIIKEFVRHAPPGSGKFIAFCEQGGVEALTNVVVEFPCYEKKLARFFKYLYDSAYNFVELHQESEQDESMMELEETPSLVHCNLTICRLERHVF